MKALQGRRSLFAPLVAAGSLASACGVPRPVDLPKEPTVDQIPIAVLVGGGQVTLGLSSDSLRQSASLSPYRITRSPVTRGQYAACEGAGACGAPSLNVDRCVEPPSDGDTPVERSIRQDVPVTCATAIEAASFCAWVGGAVPNEGQWMLAARGPLPQHYPWGDAPADCAEHPLASGSAVGCCADPSSCDPDQAFVVGQHIPGASAFGLEDVLLTGRELIAPGSANAEPACRQPAGCIVSSAAPGAIDGTTPMIDDPTLANAGQSSREGFAFRCVWLETAE